jgi:hypothetical protein
MILLTAGASASAVGLVLLRYLPREFVLGNEGVWMWKTLANYIGIKSKLGLGAADISN